MNIPLKIEKLQLNDGGETHSLFFNISELEVDDFFANLKTDPVLDVHRVNVDGNTLELRIARIPTMTLKAGDVVTFKFETPDQNET
jgi:hypothetical protein